MIEVQTLAGTTFRPPAAPATSFFPWMLSLSFLPQVAPAAPTASAVEKVAGDMNCEGGREGQRRGT